VLLQDVCEAVASALADFTPIQLDVVVVVRSQPNQMLHLHPSSGLARGSIEAPDYAVYVELVSTARPCMRHITAVTLQQLEERRSQVNSHLRPDIYI
jgi:Oligonucleotide/oligosaccharide-binding (OB)-fold